MAGTAAAEPKVARPTGRKSAPRARSKGRRRGFLAPFARVRRVEAEALLCLALFGLAMVMRWPNLLRLPHFTDEIGEVRFLLQIYRGELFPLTAQVKYFGPVHHYLVAACLWLFGPSIALPRTIVCVIGSLTVVMTYLIGRELADWRVGALGAALLATLPQHIVVNSHVAWANSTTPIYATICVWSLLRAVGGVNVELRMKNGEVGTGEGPPLRLPPSPILNSGLYLLLCGFSFGLMMQTHIGTVILAPALGGSLLFAVGRARAWRFLRSPWPYLAVVAAVVAYSPVIIDNARNGFAGYYRAKGRDYAFTAEPTSATYVHNLQNLLFELARMISNPFRTPARVLDYFTSPYMAIAVGLALLGLVVLARRGQPLPALALLATALTMPYFNHAYGVEGDRYLLTGRYVAFLLPLLTIGVAAGALWLADGAVRLIGRARASSRALPVVTRLAAAALILALVLYPIIPLRRYYTHESGLDPDNATFLETVRLVNALRGPRTPVLIGRMFSKVDLKDGADALDILDILFTLDGIPHRQLADSYAELTALDGTLDPRDTEALPLVVMMRDECFPMRDVVPLQRVSGRLRLRELYWTSPSYYAVYRYTPGLAPETRCLPAEGATPGD